MTVVASRLADEAFLAEVSAATGSPVRRRLAGKARIVFLAAEAPTHLVALSRARAAIAPDGMIWVVWPKGRKQFGEDHVRRAALAAGLVDVKVAAFDGTAVRPEAGYPGRSALEPLISGCRMAPPSRAVRQVTSIVNRPRREPGRGATRRRREPVDRRRASAGRRSRSQEGDQRPEGRLLVFFHTRRDTPRPSLHHVAGRIAGQVHRDARQGRGHEEDERNAQQLAGAAAPPPGQESQPDRQRHHRM
jgi:hypothetical protein